MKSNNQNINRAIKKATGYDIKICSKGGSCIFYSDHEKTDLMLHGMYENSVMVYAISHLSVERWVQEFIWTLGAEDLPATLAENKFPEQKEHDFSKPIRLVSSQNKY